jgi:hypothetical protein
MLVDCAKFHNITGARLSYICTGGDYLMRIVAYFGVMYLTLK